MKRISVLLMIIVALAIGFGAGYWCQCFNNKQLAIVDVAAVVNRSEQVQALKAEQTQKTQELTQWLQNAQNDVKKETDKDKQKALLQKYNEEFSSKAETMKQEYADKVQSIEASITKTIVSTAKEKGYKYVVPKGIMLYGGDDITDAVAETIK
jgi:DNA phosphorothioation-dependent restriction protein DptG